MRIHITFLLLALLCSAAVNAFADRPNVILIMTDDQGYGDLGCHGNPVLKTPNLDRLHDESVRLTDFHVSPFCTPTRAALMTGRYPARTGAYRTSSGRTMLHTDETTIAELFAAGGYATGMVGKWHLGDNAPHRPQDRGFQDVVWHRCGGIGQASDYYGNDYFDDTYERNGKYEKFEGYCTDVFFAEAMRFVEENKKKPFYLYLATNAPHSPYRVDRKWSDPYKETVKWRWGAEFYGMITNLDHNVGLLRERLDELGLAESTIVIFMTDNGTSKGIGGTGPSGKRLGPDDFKGFNAGMRGVKSTVFEGGHRVPFFIHWPAGGLTGGRDISDLSAHIDVLPTLAELCGVPVTETRQLDGKSFADRLKNPNALPHRDHYITQLHGGAHFAHPKQKWDTSCVVKDRWRLMDGEKLYNLDQDLMQNRNISAAHPDKVAELRALYEQYWKSVTPRMTPVSIDLGNPAQNPTLLCSQDWYLPKGNPPWHFGPINRLVRESGPWMVDVKKAGRYRLSLRQFPPEANRNVVAVRAKVRIAGKEMESEVKPRSKAVVFEIDLPAGKTKLETWLFDDKGQAGGAYFTEVEAIGRSTDAEASNDSRSANPPNFVVILTDDHRADYLGCAGHPVLKTPHLDRLAAEGIRFRHAFATSAACTPNRTCLLTGQYERKHGVTFGSGSSLTAEAFSETYPMQLREAGYYVGYVGKNHTPIGLAENNKSFDSSDYVWSTADKTYFPGESLGYDSGVMEMGFDYWYGNHGHSRFYPKGLHPIYKNAVAHTQIEIFQEGALNFLNSNPEFAGTKAFLRTKPDDKPFCLLVNFNVPHGAGTSSMRQLPKDPKLYRTRYRDQIDQMPLPGTYIAKEDIGTPKIPPHVYNGKYIPTYDYVQTPETLRERLVRICQTVTGVDELVGALVSELKRQGVYDNTVIVFTSDHGIQHGEHGLGGKVLLYEESIRVPMIIFDPRLPEDRRGTVADELALSIDIAPTILELAGVPISEEIQGKSLTSIMRVAGSSWRNDFFCENMFMGQHYPRIEGVRSKDFKYIRYFDKKNDRPHHRALTSSIRGEVPIYEELFDMQSDPEERKNLADSPTHREVLDRYRERCQQLVVEAKGGSDYPKTHLRNAPPKK